MTDPFSCLDLKHMWHLARVLLPRRSQHGGWVWGLVWRRRDGGRWHYKRWSALVALAGVNIAILAD